MSRIGRRPIAIPTNVVVAVSDGNAVTVKGPKGELSAQFRSLHGLTRTLLSNMVIGVTDGFRKNLEILGVGYRAAMDGTTLVLSVGYSHPVRMTPLDGITFTVDGTTKVAVTGHDKQRVGEEAARIRRTRPPEPYKGKGIRYEGEVVRRKAGKTGKAK